MQSLDFSFLCMVVKFAQKKEAEISESIYCFNLFQVNKYNTQTAHSAVCIYGFVIGVYVIFADRR